MPIGDAAGEPCCGDHAAPCWCTLLADSGREHGSTDWEEGVSVRIAVVGCGAIARAFHLPALAAIPGV